RGTKYLTLRSQMRAMKAGHASTRSHQVTSGSELRRDGGLYALDDRWHKAPSQRKRRPAEIRRRPPTGTRRLARSAYLSARVLWWGGRAMPLSVHSRPTIA